MNALYTPSLTTIYRIFSKAIKHHCFLIEFFHTLKPMVKYSRHIYQLGFCQDYPGSRERGLNIGEIPFSPPRRRGPGYSLLNFLTVYFNLYGTMEQLSSKPRFKIGDKVRISK